uniref:Deoxyuridine 5'-triphosphate nucleotidohydrolase n=1 Tax=Timema bartmani TaxID=61472 RepID=A0A7R9I263_9NEOP|nr:unnamed protein product [Timema bartmani]
MYIILPRGWYGRIYPRSSLDLHYGIDVLARVIDKDYRVLLINHGDVVFIIKRGDKIAQLVCVKIDYPRVEHTDSLYNTQRGEGGFGLSDTTKKNRVMVITAYRDYLETLTNYGRDASETHLVNVMWFLDTPAANGELAASTENKGFATRLDLTHHVDCLRVDSIADDATLRRHKLHHLVQCSPLHLLPLEVGQRVRDKVEQHAALSDLLDKQFFTLVTGSVCNKET